MHHFVVSQGMQSWLHLLWNRKSCWRCQEQNLWLQMQSKFRITEQKPMAQMDSDPFGVHRLTISKVQKEKENCFVKHCASVKWWKNLKGQSLHWTPSKEMAMHFHQINWTRNLQIICSLCLATKSQKNKSIRSQTCSNGHTMTDMKLPEFFTWMAAKWEMCLHLWTWQKVPVTWQPTQSIIFAGLHTQQQTLVLIHLHHI